MLRILTISLSFFGVFIVLSHGNGVKANQVYTVSNIQVDARAASATNARQVAIWEAHAIGLKRLLRRLTLPEDWQRLPNISGKDALKFSISYAADEERNSATRYIGRISVRFIPDKVRAVLEQSQIPFGDVQISPILVIPIFDLPNARRLIWDEENAWRKAWERSDIGEALTPFILPVGDIEDIQIVPRGIALLEQRERLFQLAKRYRAHRVLLAFAQLTEIELKGKTSYALGVKLDLLSARGDRDEQMQFETSSIKDVASLNANAVESILRMTALAWKRQVIVYHDESSTNEIIVHFDSIGEWQNILSLLNQVPILKNYQIKRIDNQSAQIEISHFGTKDVFALALKQKNFILTIDEDEDELWQIRLRK